MFNAARTAASGKSNMNRPAITTPALTEEAAIEMIQAATQFLSGIYHQHQIVEIVEESYIDDEDEDGPEGCSTCRGTGEGMADGVSCPTCRGRG